MSSCWRIDSISTCVIPRSFFAWAAALPNAHALSPGLPSQLGASAGGRATALMAARTTEGLGLEERPGCVESIRDGAGEREHGDDDEAGDHGENDAVLGHRLTGFDAEPRAHESGEIGESHDGFTSFAAGGVFEPNAASMPICTACPFRRA